MYSHMTHTSRKQQERKPAVDTCARDWRGFADRAGVVMPVQTLGGMEQEQAEDPM